MDSVVLTKEGVQNLEEELKYLIKVKRPEVGEKIRTAREFGDLSENAEYDAAQNELAIMEARIKDIEEILKVVVIVDKSDLTTEVVMVGSIVTIIDCEFPEDGEMVYTIVGKTESDPMNNKISDQSPVGKALLGHKKGDKVLVEAPGGSYEIEIVNISLE